MIKAIAFTTCQFYQDLSVRLEKSLARFAIPYEFERVTHPGSWHAAVSMKPSFIRRMLEATTMDGVLYLDADAEVVAPLPFEELDLADVAFTHFQRSLSHPPEMLTGTMFFRKSMETLIFLDAWSERVPLWRYSHTPEQDALKQTIVDLKPTLRMMDLGPAWTYIHDDFAELYPDVRPLIKHYQASREYREREARDARVKEKASRQAQG